MREELQRLLGVAQLLVAEVADPGTEALAAIHCAEGVLMRVPLSEDAMLARARTIADQREWGDTRGDPLAKRYYDTAIASMMDLMRGGDETEDAFRRGVRAAVQAAVHDLAELVKRRARMGVSDDRTAVIIGIGRRIASMAMPVAEDQITEPMDRNVLMAKVARLILPNADWESVASFTSDGQFLDEAGQPVEGTDLMRTVWRIADEIVVLVRYV